MSGNELLSAAWIAAKQAEKEAVERRRQIEDALIESLHISQQEEGTINFNEGDYKLKIVSKLNRKVDSEKLQEVAAENGLEEHLSSLFRWKPEINAAVWKSTNHKITDILNAAITTTPGRPTFSIEKIDSNQ